MESSLAHLVHSGLQWIFVGGKGGVGKTTTSCALATLLATTAVPDSAGQLRYRRVLLVSTDPAHNVSDAFNQQLGPQPTAIRGMSNLFAMEVDPAHILETAMSEKASTGTSPGGAPSSSAPFQLPAIFSELGGIMKDAAKSLPGIDEVTVLSTIMKRVRQSAAEPQLSEGDLLFDVVVFDTAPTGHTLRLLALPQTINDTMERLLSSAGVASLIDVASATVFGPGQDGSSGDGGDGAPAGGTRGVKHTLEHWKGDIEEIQRIFTDASKTAFVCVCIAEFLSVYETERLIQELMKVNIYCDSLVVNQLVMKPDFESTSGEARIPTPACRMCEARKRIQTKYLQQIDTLYGEDFHVVRMPLMSDEVRGVPALKQFSQFLLEAYDPNVHGYVDIITGGC